VPPADGIFPGTVLDELEDVTPAPSVLVAEDQQLLRWAIGKALETLGVRAVFAATYQDACDHLANESFAAVILSSPLDGRSVSGLLAELVREHPHTRLVVLCTGDHCDGVLTVARRASVLTKPFAVSELMAAVAPALVGTPFAATTQLHV
jgi:two-component system response regulator VanR